VSEAEVRQRIGMVRELGRRAIQSKHVDWVATLLALGIPLITWIRAGKPKERLADVEVPTGVLASAIVARWVGLRRDDRIYAEFGERMAELGTFLGTRMRQGDERSQQLLDLQASLERYAGAADVRDQDLLRLSSTVERLTRWLVALTVVLGVIGLVGIGVAVWAAVR
jgi:hypothetical protein